MTSKLKRAINYAKKCHKGQIRVSGEPYVAHSLNVLERVKSIGLSEKFQIVAVLHDICENCNVNSEKIKKRFGVDVEGMVIALSKDPKKDFITAPDPYSLRLRYYLKKLEDGIYYHPELALIKLCDQLDNLNTVMLLSEQKYYRYLISIQFYYLPLYSGLIPYFRPPLINHIRSFYYELHKRVSRLLAKEHKQHQNKCTKGDKVAFA